MAPDRRLWLIGVRKEELAPTGGAQFINQLLQRYRGRELKRDEGTPSVVREVVAQADLAALQREHGKEYVKFFYVTESLVKAARDAGIKLHQLQLVLGAVPGAEVFTAIALPPMYGD